jgi:thiol:disulfide interchange protein DsbC
MQWAEDEQHTGRRLAGDIDLENLMKKLLLAAVLALTTGLAFAQGAANSKKGAPAAAPSAEEQTIRARLEQTFNLKPSKVSPTPFGWYEIIVDAEVYYVDPQANYVFNGSVIDTRTRQNLTQARKDDLMKVDYAKLPLDQAVRIRVGKGTRQFVTFEDPNCGFCRKLHNDLKGLTDYTLYIFLYPILSPDSTEKAKAIWCAKDRGATWNALMLEGKAPPPAPADCKHPLEANLQLGRKLGVNGTPTLIFQDGSRMPGASSVEAIEQRFAAAKK